MSLVSLPAQAQEPETIYYQGVGKTEAKRLFQEATGRAVSDEALQALPNVVLPVEDDIWFLGAPQGRGCEDEVRTQMLEVTGGSEGAFELLVDLAQMELDQLDHETARASFGLVAQAIPCTSDLLSREMLAKLFLYFGLAAFYDSDLDVARSHFRQSVQFSGHPAWDPAYPPAPEVVYQAAAEEVEAYGRIDLGYRLSGINLETFSIDGEDLLGSAAIGGLRVLPGTHVIQWRRLGGDLQTRVVDVPRGAQLVSTQGLQELLALPPEIGKEDSLTGLVQESFFARHDGSASVLVVEEATGEPKFAYTYLKVQRDNPEEAVRYHLGKPKDLTVRQREVRYSPIELQVGGAYVLGTTFGATMRGGFWLKTWQPLSMGIVFGFDLAFTGYLGLTKEENRVALLPSPSAGVRVEFRPERPIKPYATLLARAHFGDNPRVLAGPVLAGGATFMFLPPRGREKATSRFDGALGFWLEAGGGPLFSSAQPRGTFWAAAGLTLRPYTLKR